MRTFRALVLCVMAELVASFSNLPPISKSTVACCSAVDPVASPMVKVGSGEAIVDAATLLEGQAFPIKPDALIGMAKSYLTSDFIAQGESMSDAGDFQFMGPVVGPLSKEAYLKAIASFDVYSIFPDINPRYYSFSADPFDAGRVWAISRGIGTNPESGKSFEAPPQAVSVTFNEAGKVVKFTIGHVMDVSVGNTGGLGGLFGPLYAVGKGLPFREAQPYKPSLRYRAFNFIGSLASKVSGK